MLPFTMHCQRLRKFCLKYTVSTDFTVSFSDAQLHVIHLLLNTKWIQHEIGLHSVHFSATQDCAELNLALPRTALSKICCAAQR